MTGGCIGGSFGATIGLNHGYFLGISYPIDVPVQGDPLSSPYIRSSDPNDKLAPIGAGEGHFIDARETLAYTVRFENQPSATGPAREIVVTDQLDASLDLDTFELSEIAFAGTVLTVPRGMSRYETTLPLVVDGQNIVVEVSATLDRGTREFKLTLRAVDPTTGWFPENPLIGLLYPNDATHRGEGHVSYSVRPLAGLPSGTVITNEARIVFDYNDAIDTPPVFNTLDAGGPTSRILPLPATSPAGAFELRWTGADEPGGSGIASYDIYVSIDGGAPFLLHQQVTGNSQTIRTAPDHTYAFYTVARDLVGHVERPPTTPDAITRILAGDVTGDGRVDLDDVNVVRNNFGRTDAAAQGDTDFDGDIDLEDLNNVRDNFGAQDQFFLGDTDGDADVDLADLNNVRNNFGLSGPDILGDTNGDLIVDLIDLNAVRNHFGSSTSGAPLLRRPGDAPPLVPWESAASAAVTETHRIKKSNTATDALFGLFGEKTPQHGRNRGFQLFYRC